MFLPIAAAAAADINTTTTVFFHILPSDFVRFFFVAQRKSPVPNVTHFITVIRFVYIWFLMKQKVNWTSSIALKCKFNTNGRKATVHLTTDI